MLDAVLHVLGAKLGNPIFKFRIKKESYSYSKNIQKILHWYFNNHQKLDSDIKSGLHMGQLFQFIEKTAEVNGEILELGVFRGGTSICMAKFLEKINSNRNVISCDTFSGFPYDDKHGSDIFVKAQSYMKNNTYSSVKEKCTSFGMENRIKLIEGAFEDTLYQKLSDERFSFVFSDSDLYDSTKFSLEFLKTRMCKGGIIVFHNYGETEFGIWGETRAVDEFCQENKMNLNTDKSLPYIKF